MKLLATRHERAFERVYQRHVGDVYRYAFVVLSDEQDAEDVTETTFRNAYHGFRHGHQPRPGLNRLLTIAHDVCRHRGGHPRPDESFLVEDGGGPRPRGSMTCWQAERAVCRQLDGELTRRDGRRLGTHLSSCEDCGTFARGQRAQRAALRALAAVPLPASLRTVPPPSASFAPAGRLSG